MIEVKEMRSHADIKRFVLFPWTIYKDNPNWVPPLISEQCKFFDPKKNPYYAHSRVRLLMAFREGKAVGRLSVHENIQHVKRHKEQIGFFGFFECIDDTSVAQALFANGKSWLKTLGYETMRGPANFSINGEYSLLVDGFDSPPVVMMTYNPPYYERLLQACGFTSSQEMYAYQIYTQKGLPEHVIKRANEVSATRKDFVVRKMNLRRLEDEAKIVFNIYRQAWDDNWGAVPPTEAEIMALAKELKMIIDEDIAYIGELNGKPIGFSLSIPDANQALQVANGRLFPFGLIKLLLKKRSINGIRVLAMGVLKEHRHQGFDAVFYKQTYEEGMKKGYITAEASLINETNTPMRHVLEKIGARIYKTYRMFDSPI